MAKLQMIVIDALKPSALARFWESVLDGFEIRAYDDAEIAGLAARGLTPETDPAVALDGPDLIVFFQQTSEPKRHRNRVHVDVTTPDVGAEVERLCALGASVREERSDLTIMLDPEGNEFCVVPDPTQNTGTSL